MIAGAGAGAIKQVAFGGHHLNKVAVIADGLDALGIEDQVFIAGHHDHGAKLQAFGQVHGGEGCLAAETAWPWAAVFRRAMRPAAGRFQRGGFQPRYARRSQTPWGVKPLLRRGSTQAATCSISLFRDFYKGTLDFFGNQTCDAVKAFQASRKFCWGLIGRTRDMDRNEAMIH